MPAVVFSPEDEALIEELLERYDPEGNPEMARLADKVPPDDWAFFVEYTRRDFRQSAYTVMIAKAVVKTSMELGLANRAGGECLLNHDWVTLSNLAAGWEPESKERKDFGRYCRVTGAYPDKILDDDGHVDRSVLSDVAFRFYDAIREALLADLFA